MTGAYLAESALPILPGDAGHFDLTIASKKRILASMSDSPQPTLPVGQQPQPTVDLSAYRGCWVALVGEQVAGVGATAEAARLAAHRSRPRERISATLWVPDEPGAKPMNSQA
jgi:hypothetical protein